MGMAADEGIDGGCPDGRGRLTEPNAPISGRVIEVVGAHLRGVGGDVGGFDGGPDVVAGLEGEGVEGGGGDLGDERDLAVEADADAVGLAVDVDDGARPYVAGAAVGWCGVEGDAVGLDDGEGGAVDVVGGDDASAGGGGDGAVGGRCRRAG